MPPHLMVLHGKQQFWSLKHAQLWLYYTLLHVQVTVDLSYPLVLFFDLEDLLLLLQVHLVKLQVEDFFDSVNSVLLDNRGNENMLGITKGLLKNSNDEHLQDFENVRAFSVLNLISYPLTLHQCETEIPL